MRIMFLKDKLYRRMGMSVTEAGMKLFLAVCETIEGK